MLISSFFSRCAAKLQIVTEFNELLSLKLLVGGNNRHNLYGMPGGVVVQKKTRGSMKALKVDSMLWKLSVACAFFSENELDMHPELDQNIVTLALTERLRKMSHVAKRREEKKNSHMSLSVSAC